jgi:hypothetical protein
MMATNRKVDGIVRAKRKPPASLAAYEFMLRANALLNVDPNGEAEPEARILYEKVIKLDPGDARERALLETIFRSRLVASHECAGAGAKIPQ